MAVMVSHPVNILKTTFQGVICVVCELYLNRSFFFLVISCGSELGHWGLNPSPVVKQKYIQQWKKESDVSKSEVLLILIPVDSHYQEDISFPLLVQLFCFVFPFLV